MFIRAPVVADNDSERITLRFHEFNEGFMGRLKSDFLVEYRHHTD